MPETINVAIGAEVVPITVPLPFSLLKLAGPAFNELRAATRAAMAAAKQEMEALGLAAAANDLAAVSRFMNMDEIKTTALSIKVVSVALLKSRPDLTADVIEDRITPEQMMPIWNAASEIRTASMPKVPSTGEATTAVIPPVNSTGPLTPS